MQNVNEIRYDTQDHYTGLDLNTLSALVRLGSVWSFRNSVQKRMRLEREARGPQTLR